MKYTKSILFIMFCTLSELCGAWEMNLEQEGGQAYLQLDDLPYPLTELEKQLDSGLPNDIEISVHISNNSKRLLVYRLSYSVIYDLWEEHYTLVTNQAPSFGGSPRAATEVFKGKKALVNHLKQCRIDIPKDVDNLIASGGYTFESQVFVNPIKSKRVKKIQKWVENSFNKNRVRIDSSIRINTAAINSGPGSTTGLSKSIDTVSSRSRGPRFKKLFDQILDQYATSDVPAAQWRSEVMRMKVPASTKNE
ncbi:MAG: hypothetical protein COA42_14555 [Alteromonadaceae bacterium]|nr:MAG: hypothetical protein COA42_14555 [Alteromonadaceae bacterium]